MRYIASFLLLAWMSLSGARSAGAAVNSSAPGPQLDAQTEAQKAYGALEETPNQRRIRLGEPIVASYPPPDYGELLETPNQRRQRLASQTASLK